MGGQVRLIQRPMGVTPVLEGPPIAGPDSQQLFQGRQGVLKFGLETLAHGHDIERLGVRRVVDQSAAGDHQRAGEISRLEPPPRFIRL